LHVIEFEANCELVDVSEVKHINKLYYCHPFITKNDFVMYDALN